MRSREQGSEIRGIHHLGLAVRDHDASFATYEKLGFTLTALSIHRWANRPGDEMVLSGTGNRCAVLSGGNYLEITAEVGTPPLGVGITPRARRVARYDGLHIIAFDAEDLASVEQRLRSAGFSTPGVVTLERDVDTPEGTRTVRFERVVAESDQVEELLQVVRHLTPEYVFQKPSHPREPGPCDHRGDLLC